VGNFHFGKTAGCRRVHCRNDLRHVPLHNAPAPQSQYDDGYLAARKVLLITKIFVRRHQNVKPCGLGQRKQFAVFQFFPPRRTGFRYRVMVDQITGDSRGVPLSNKTSIYGRGVGASALCAANSRTA